MDGSRKIFRITGLILALSIGMFAADVVVTPQENPAALKNSLKGIRGRSGGQMGDYATLSTERDHLCWNDLETKESDGIDMIRNRCNTMWADYPARNIKVIARVMGTWPGSSQVNRYPSDVVWDENNAQFQARVLRLVERLGIVWDNDPRVAFVESGIAGSWGEGTFGGAFGVKFRDAYNAAFKNKKIMKRYTGDYEPCTWGINWDSFAHPDQWGTINDWLNLSSGQRWKTAVLGGEIAYDWGGVAAVLGSSLSASLANPAYYNRLINCAYMMHATQEGSSGGANVTASPSAALYQNALGYRFVIDTLTYPSTVQTGQSFTVSFTVRNLGSAPMYYPWPVQASLLNKTTHAPVWSAIFDATDIRQWLPGSDWNVPDMSNATFASSGYAYRTPAARNHETGAFTIPSSVPSGEYVLALAVLDRDGGMLPNLRFAINNYWQGGYHPMGIIGVGVSPASTAIDASTFFTGINDATLHYIVPAADATPPTAPTGLSGQGTSQSAISLTWTAATDAESGVREYNVYRAGVKVATTAGTSYTDLGLSSLTSYSYQVSAVNNQLLEGPKCAAITVSTTDDITAPTISYAAASGIATRVIVVFSEPVEQTSAQNAGNYAISNGISISAASLGSDLKTVTLTVSALTKATTYVLTVNNIRDRAPTPNTIAANTTAQFQFTDLITKIRYYPRAGMGARMAGGIFEGSNGSRDSGPYTTLYTIGITPADQWTDVTSFTNPDIGYRYIRYRQPNGGACNVAEIEFYRGALKATGVPFGTPGSWGNSGNDFTKAFDGNTATFFDAPVDAGAYCGLDLAGGATVMHDPLPAIGADARELRLLSHATVAVPAGRFTLRVVNAAGVTVVRQSGIGPRTCDLSSVGAGTHCVTVTSGGATITRVFLNVK